MKKMCLIGLGGAGSNVIDYIYSKGINAEYAYISDPDRPHFNKEITFIPFNTNGRLLNEHMTEHIAIPDEILDLFKDNSQYVLFAGLGGYTGTLLLTELAKILQEQKKDFIIFSSLPFSFESLRRINIQPYFKKLIHIPSFKYYDFAWIRERYGNLKLIKALKLADDLIYQMFVNECLNSYDFSDN